MSGFRARGEGRVLLSGVAEARQAPIAIFAYNRPAHVTRLLESLAANRLAPNATVRIYCDGPKPGADKGAIAATRQAVAQHAPSGAEIIERKSNLGLARSIISGVTDLCEEFGRVVVLEDDLILAPGTLDYLNGALDRYADDERVMHVSAYMFPVRGKLPEAFFYREATCWGWATWARAWKYFEPDADKLIAEIDARGARHEFDIRGSMYFYEMLRKQRDGQIDSWAIRWYASLFKQGGLALHPGGSFIQNHGFDGSGIHCNVDERFEVAFGGRAVERFPDVIEESEAAVNAMIDYRNSWTAGARPLGNRVRRFVSRLVRGT